MIELFGTPRVMIDGAPLEVDTRKAIAVLAVLAATGRQTREALSHLLWPDAEPERARAALRRTLSVLNGGLGEGRLAADRANVELADDTAQIDIQRFEQAATTIDEHGHDSLPSCDVCLETMRDGVALHRGAFLEGFVLRGNPEFDEWVDARAEHYRRELCVMLDHLTEAEVQRGELDAALAHAERWLSADPLNEQVHARLMLLHAWTGDRGLAIKRYRELAGLLDRELGVAPLESTTRIYEAVLEGRVQRPGQMATPRTVLAATPSPRASVELPFVGRGDLVRQVAAHFETQDGVAAVIEGEAGIGKTRFVEELEASFHRAGKRVLPSRCHHAERRIALAPIVDLLRMAGIDRRSDELPPWVRTELGRLLPESMGPVSHAPALDDPGGRHRLHEALRLALESSAIGDGRGVVIVLEDAHFADDATLELLAYLCDHLYEHRLAMLVTFRSEDVAPAHPLRRLGRGESNFASWRLTRLDPNSVEALSRAVLEDGNDVDRQVARIVDEAEGLPLAVVEYLNWVQTQDGDVADWPIPTGLRELIESRLSALSEGARQLLSAAAVVGHPVAPDVLARTAGRSDDEVVSGVEELVQLGLLVERGETYEFTHDKIRAVAYEATTPARRRLLHGRVVDALSPRAKRRSHGVLAAVVAEHARLGGREEDAAIWSVAAGDHALSVLAHTEANEHYERALALGHPSPSAVHRRLARSRMLLGDYLGALEAYETAAAHASEDELATIEHELGVLHLRHGNYGLARAHLETANRSLSPGDDIAAARVTADLGLLALKMDDLTAATALAKQALGLAERAEDRHALAQARNLAGLVARRRGDTADAHRQLEHAAALAAGLPDPTAYIAALNNLALSTLDAGEHARAEELLRTALDRCERQGDRHRKAAILNNLADLHHLRGEDEDTMTLLKEAVAIFAEVGGTSLREPEIWKLTEW